MAHRLFALIAGLLLMTHTPAAQAQAAEPVRVAIVGLTHDHVFWLLARPRDLGDIEIVAVCEANDDLAERRMKEFSLDPSIHYTDLGRMLAETKPEAVCLFGDIKSHHPDAIRCLAAGAHVMVEKPLAINYQQAAQMADAAQQAGKSLLTNYETTWYPSHAELKRQLDSGEHGAVRRMEFRTGHGGPIEIGCRAEFLEWLLDPDRNGGGAVTDFGCYGANLATWLSDGRPPRAVTAVTRQLKPQLYPRVDDDATLTLEYPDKTVVIQASWNWTHGIKQTTVNAERGELTALDSGRLRVHALEQSAMTIECRPMAGEQRDPFAHLAAVARGGAAPNELSSIENNLVVMRVLDAARRSAESGQRVVLE